LAVKLLVKRLRTGLLPVEARGRLTGAFGPPRAGSKRVALNQRFVPSSEGQMGVVLADWGASVVPELHVRNLLAGGQLQNLAHERTLPVELFWHCWNLDSVLLDNLTRALANAASQVLAN